MINNEMFTSPDKCIQECDKQIKFAKSLITYLEQYITQLETMKTMANSAKTLQDANPFKYMLQFMEALSSKSSKDSSCE